LSLWILLSYATRSVRSSAGRIEEANAKRLRRSAEPRVIWDSSERMLYSFRLDEQPPDGSIHQQARDIARGAKGMPLKDAQIAKVRSLREHLVATRLATLMMLFLWITTATASGTPVDRSEGCKTNPAVVGKCFLVEERVSVYNGTPSIRIVPKGTKCLLGVVPAEDEIMPSDPKDAVGLDRDAFAEMEVCPMSQSKPGHVRFVCVGSARHIESRQR
jgi:hypothetical protein